MTNKIRLTKSMFTSGCQCEKKLWIDENGPSELKVPFETNNLIEEAKHTKVVARKYYGKGYGVVSEIYARGVDACCIETEMFLADKECRVICDAVFEYDGLTAVIDMVRKYRNKYDLILVKAATSIDSRFVDELSFQYYVATKCGLEVNKCYIFTINGEYERGRTLNLKELFDVVDFTPSILKRAEKIESEIEFMRNTLSEEEEIEKDVGMHCFQPFACPYFAHCKKCNGIPERSIFEIPRQQKKTSVKLYEDGIVTLSQALDIELAKPIEKQNVSKIVFLRQETGDKTKDYICRSDLSDFMSSLYYPLYFLDFETFTQAVPSYRGQKPYEQIPFQYSLHYIPSKGAPVHHKEFLAKEGIDPRRDLAKQLIEDIPEDACVLAYNMSFEKNVILRLSDYLPEYSLQLDIIHAHIDDLMIPFQKRWFYKYDMHGSYSIKKVLPALFPDDPALNYANLDKVHKGDEAMLQFKLLPTYSEEERLAMREALLRYCELDTFAMVRIYFEIERVCQEEIKPSESKRKRVAAKKQNKVIRNEDVIQD